jgi:hypothetical protein
MYNAYVSTTFDLLFLIGGAKQISGHVLELMAGTGRVSIPLAEAGVQLTSMDQSPEMFASPFIIWVLKKATPSRLT